MKLATLWNRLREQFRAGRSAWRLDTGRSKVEDPGLSEVKAVLQSLQHFSAEPDSAGQEPAAEDMAYPAHARMRRIAMVAVAISAALALLGTLMFFSFRQPTTPTARVLTPKSKTSIAPSGTDTPRTIPPAAQAIAKPPPRHTAQTVLQTAMAQMTSGRVQAARRELLDIAADGSADVAWALARSYDPNFLNAIPGADAVPDIVEATRWYRRWYAIAVEQGLVADSVPLERIIRSMR